MRLTCCHCCAHSESCFIGAKWLASCQALAHGQLICAVSRGGGLATCHAAHRHRAQRAVLGVHLQASYHHPTLLQGVLYPWYVRTPDRPAVLPPRYFLHQWPSLCVFACDGNGTPVGTIVAKVHDSWAWPALLRPRKMLQKYARPYLLLPPGLVQATVNGVCLTPRWRSHCRWSRTRAQARCVATSRCSWCRSRSAAQA
jgi:hypothetical protein